MTNATEPQDLDPNAVATATLLNPSIPASDPSATPFSLSPKDFIARHFPAKGTSTSSSTKRPPAPHALGTGAIVFNQRLPINTLTTSPRGTEDVITPSTPRILLVQRAPHDSMPLKWEVPGGGCDSDDPSILYSCARELYEEAGLVATSVGPLVVCPSYSRSNLAKNASDQNGEAFGPAEAEAEWGERMGGQFFFSRSGKLICKFQFVVEVERGEEHGVRLDANEHVAYVWASEEECRSRQVDESGNPGGIVTADGGKSEEKRLEFASREQWDIVMKAFELWKGK